MRAKLPGCDHYVVTTFFEPPIRRKCEADTTLVPPILRKEILDAKKRARPGDHVLVYQTSTSDTKLARRAPARRASRSSSSTACARSRAARELARSRSSARTGFVDDLAAAQAVVCNGGLSLIGEAIYLGKPIFSVPVRNQYEQVLNARYLEQLGYGLEATQIEAELLRLFLAEAPKYAARVAKHKQDGNRELFALVDRLLERLAHKKKRAKDREA